MSNNLNLPIIHCGIADRHRVDDEQDLPVIHTSFGSRNRDLKESEEGQESDPLHESFVNTLLEMTEFLADED